MKVLSVSWREHLLSSWFSSLPSGCVSFRFSSFPCVLKSAMLCLLAELKTSQLQRSVFSWSVSPGRLKNLCSVSKGQLTSELRSHFLSQQTGFCKQSKSGRGCLLIDYQQLTTTLLD
ncbi:hypothetical protein FKM82_025285 [Ascaphus truei]